MAIKLIALDMDGTLLSTQGKILESSKKALSQALEQGIKVVLCSGRPIAGLTHYLKELGITGPDQYVLTLNGAISLSADGQIITEDLVDSSYYRKMTAFSVEHNVPFNIVTADSKIITADHNIDFMVYVQAYENFATLYVRNPDEIPSDIAIAKGCFVGASELIDSVEPLVRARFEKDLYVVRADKNFLEVLNPKVNKGNGLRELCATLGISPDEVIAFGDQKNDITMFEFAGTAVAMGNGRPEAKEAADYITDTNDNDGIAKALEKYLN